jgi:hypothetical protein
VPANIEDAVAVLRHNGLREPVAESFEESVVEPDAARNFPVRVYKPREF